jgi:SAM-dependent methyltransferase
MRFTKTQVFHENLDFEAALRYLAASLTGEFRQLNSWDSNWEYAVGISKKGKVLSSQKRTGGDAPKEQPSHNREKHSLLEQGMVIPPLVDMGIFTPDGRIIKTMYDKYRQINRFVEIIDDSLPETDPTKPLTVLDFGCGKSYLTFILYYFFTEIRHRAVRMVGLDLKEEVIARCEQAARCYGYEGLSFQVGDIGAFEPTEKPDMVITLHACDTATDLALYNAIRWGTQMIFSVPCCQHELNGQIHSDSLALFTRYGAVKERIASLATDAIRCNLLEACGYKTQLLEFVAFDHTPKNLLIRAVKGKSRNAKALEEVRAAMEEFHLQPTLYRLLEEGGML